MAKGLWMQEVSSPGTGRKPSLLEQSMEMEMKLERSAAGSFTAL